MKRVTFDVDPVAKPRQTQADKWKKRPIVVRYREYADKLRDVWQDTVLPDSGIVLIFNIPMAQSWSETKKKTFEGTPHQQRPDLDNLVKGFFDALKDEDSMIWSFVASKFWAREGSVELILPEVADVQEDSVIIVPND